MTVSGEDDELELAENLAEPAEAIASGTIVGQVEGLIWSDVTGIDVVCVVVPGANVAVAVPIDSGTWRYAHVVDLKMSPAEVHSAPRVQALGASGGAAAVGMVSHHFSMPLAGPPPGPGTGTLPPWWDKGTAGGITQGDGPAPIVG
jgi:hypothetical protein